MEFPDDFTTLPRAVTAADFILLDKYRATVSQLSQALAAPVMLQQWNGTDVTQFGAANTFGTPVATVLSYVANTTGVLPILRLKLGNASPAVSGAVYWFDDLTAYQSMSIRFAVNANATNPIQLGDTLQVGVIFAGDDVTGSGIGVGITFDSVGATLVSLSGNDSYGTPAFSATMTPTASGYLIFEFNFVGSLRDTAGYPTLGCPMLTGIANSMSNFGTAIDSSIFTVDSSSGFAAGIGANPTNRVGVYVVTPTGLTADASLDISQLSIQAYPR